MVKSSISPAELFDKFESYLKAEKILGGVDYITCKLSLPAALFNPIERHLNSAAKTAEERIAEGYVIAYGEHQFILVKSNVNNSGNLDDLLIMVPTERNNMAPLDDKSLLIQPNEFGEQTFIAYLPKQGVIAVMAIKYSSPNVAASFFYPNNIETLKFHSYSDLKDISLYLEKQLGEGLYKPASLKAGINLMRQIIDK